jgi:hypothetical protein
MIFIKIGKFMSQPCVKFVSHTASYIAFISMIIASSVQYSFNESGHVNFSQVVSPDVYNAYRRFSVNSTTSAAATAITTMCKFNFEDFVLRKSTPHALNLTLTIWVAGA